MKKIMLKEGSHEYYVRRSKKVCKLGQGEKCCSFLTAGADGFECAKGTEFERIIRQKRANGEMNAKGDNCDGPSRISPTIH